MGSLLWGLRSWRYGLACPLDEAIQRTAEMGFDFLEVSFHFLRHEDKVYYWPKEMAPRHRLRIRDLLRKHGLQTGILIPTPRTMAPEQFAPLRIDDICEVSDFDVDQTRSLCWMLEQALDAARDIDAILIDDLHFAFARSSNELRGVKRMLKLAEQYDVKVGIENKNETTSEEILDILRKLQSPNAGVTFDVGHAYEFLRDSDKVSELVVNLGKSIINTHIHDFTAEAHHAYVGQGNINWIKTMRALKSIDYQGPLVLEISPEEQYVRTLAPHPDLEILRCKWILEYLAKDA